MNKGLYLNSILRNKIKKKEKKFFLDFLVLSGLCRLFDFIWVFWFLSWKRETNKLNALKLTSADAGEGELVLIVLVLSRADSSGELGVQLGEAIDLAHSLIGNAPTIDIGVHGRDIVIRNGDGGEEEQVHS